MKLITLSVEISMPQINLNGVKECFKLLNVAELSVSMKIYFVNKRLQRP